MRVLVDTHAFLWELLSDERSSRQAIQIFADKHNELVFSLVSLWEIAIKIKLGRLNALSSSVSYLRDEMAARSMELLPIRFEHILQLEALPRQHGDPFDRLLIAQALHEKLPILTNDAWFKRYGVKVLW